MGLKQQVSRQERQETQRHCHRGHRENIWAISVCSVIYVAKQDFIGALGAPQHLIEKPRRIFHRGGPTTP
jgi:hypothetical protein